jgi:predicted nucleic acid-binding protein
VSALVVDASVAVKWVIEEEGTEQALIVRRQGSLRAPELIVAECANILWKKVRRAEILRDEALLAAGLLEAADIEIVPTRSLLEAATRMAIELDHPAYDCLYLSLAVQADCRFVTADERFVRKLDEMSRAALRRRVIALREFAAVPGEPTTRRPARRTRRVP